MKIYFNVLNFMAAISFKKKLGQGNKRPEKKRDLAADLRLDWIQTFSEVKMDRHSPKQKTKKTHLQIVEQLGRL